MQRKQNKKLALGLMSGTSADGLTVALVQQTPFKIIHFKNYSYTKELQNKIINAYDFKAAQLSELNFELGKIYAQKVKQFLKDFKIKAQDIFVIGSHGQTIVHDPKSKTPHTLQIGEPAFLAAQGFNVVYNFRPKDIVLGGQGAPLIPFFDEYLFGKREPKILLNIGGIANISVVGKGVKTFGFDTGPGNTLMDHAIFKAGGNKQSYDKNGALAAKGKADTELVAKLLKDKYFSARPPKSLDRAQFGKEYLNLVYPRIAKDNLADVLATLNLFTAAAIQLGIEKYVFNSYKVKEVVISGGGVYNKTLVRNLALLLPGLKITDIEKYGINPHAKEAAAFALMALLAVQGKINHCPAATGAKKAAILGNVTF